ncbi:ribonuclease R [Anaerotalea alkaliphila]|uniref:Ribonuclease R n=1 Tax=Anaerotalea alkaliphila TaxID=2662126 RepID=A0A7X5HT53_9FIRM|nr:ribonuclease R [Anaerotalea alkaliphila]NDL66200.1 ribonuclease R [Anaerotalea alkaliphila]
MEGDLLKEEQKKALLEVINDPGYAPMKIKELAHLLQVQPEERERLDENLRELVKTAKVVLTKHGKYMPNKSSHVLAGKFIAHQKGFGFVRVEGQEDDIFIPATEVQGAFHGDLVTIKVNKGTPEGSGKRKEGRVVEVLERGRTDMVGTFEKSRNYGFVVLDNKKFSKDVFIRQGKENGAVSGHKVVVRITHWGDEDRKPEGEIVEIIGHVNDPGVDILSIVRDLGIPTEFPELVMAQSSHVSQTIPEEEAKRRLDIRSWQTVTIDGEDAKDLDDAITIRKKQDGYELGVHIADVSHYVREGTALDEEALERGTSVYLVDRVIPMLPHSLSNGICSLNAGEDRLALSCIMQVDNKGHVTSHKVAETLINVDRRMSYTEVKKILEDKDPDLVRECHAYLDMFKDMEELAALLRAKRKTRGSIDFDFPETKVILNEQGELVDIRAYDRNVATKIIEECMLLANETIAESYYWQQVPFVYRTHDEPDPDKIQALGEFIYNFGYHMKATGEIHPREIQKLLADIDGTPEEPIISRLTLRSMKQARYTVSNDGHYGLAAKFYCHFTSPIRRYPDLQIHRIIKEVLRGKMNESRIQHYDKILEKVAIRSSEMERRAAEAERETTKLKKVEYMAMHVGEAFQGVISGITGWGMYVELENTIEGLIHVTSLWDDYYYFDEKQHCMIGERTSKVFRMGDVLTVKVVGVDKDQRTIDFAIHDPEAEENPSRPQNGRAQSPRPQKQENRGSGARGNAAREKSKQGTGATREKSKQGTGAGRARTKQGTGGPGGGAPKQGDGNRGRTRKRKETKA